jgi:poly-gamma-glutamate system protein
MRRRPGRVRRTTLLVLTLVAILVYYIATLTIHSVREVDAADKLRAAELSARAQEVILESVDSLGYPIDLENDPQGTGLIGPQLSIVTTDRGVIASKILSTDPNFAAVFVELLRKADLGRGDVVAVGVTGSFPALNIAFYAACEELEIRPIVITSVGASMWGANRPRLTWLDMERILADRGVFRVRSIAASIGGGNDSGRGLSPEGRDSIRAAAKRCGVPFIEEPLLDQSIEERMRRYDAEAERLGVRIRAYVNIGGGLASLGSTQNGKLLRTGLNRRLPVANFPMRGCIIRFAERGLPVLHFLNVVELAERYGITTEITEFRPEIGRGQLYEREHYNVTVVAILLGAFMIVLWFFLRMDMDHYLFRRQKPGDDEIDMI